MPMKHGLNQGTELKRMDRSEGFRTPRRSIHDYGTVGCTKDPVGRRK